jgi:hypothetical protein
VTRRKRKLISSKEEKILNSNKEEEKTYQKPDEGN